ncbi:MAG: hypothetical protein KJ774_03545 [Firmicutes bacterium]|nr:hypothetical protein [Bacillota bacterium]
MVIAALFILDGGGNASQDVEEVNRIGRAKAGVGQDGRRAAVKGMCMTNQTTPLQV